MKTVKTRHALLLSVMSLVLCLAMLTGTTFAWFTDTVTSARNTIQAGTLDVALYYSVIEDGAWTTYAPVDKNVKIFNYDKWEPGYVSVAKFKIVNEGTLALKYELLVDVFTETIGKTKNNEDIQLSKYVLYGVTEDLTTLTDRDAALALATKPFNSFEIDADKILNKDEFVEVAVAIGMPETVGNEANHDGYNAPSIEFGVNLFATQLGHESDSFGPDYDDPAPVPAVDVATKVNEEISLSAGGMKFTVPAAAANGNYSFAPTTKETENQDGSTSLVYDFGLTLDGQPAETDGTLRFETEIPLGKLLDVTGVSTITRNVVGYEYNAATGVLKIFTTSLNPVNITYTDLKVEGLEMTEDGKIVAGTFEGTNPATLDPTLKEADSEYIAINYVQNGKTYFVVAERATTVLVAPGADTGYTAVNGNYEVVAGSGKLYSIISGLQNNEHSTVYLLPGTYNEGTTVYIYSSMDIIGLGDKADIKVVKVSSSDSNRHLFNANGTKADYICVTIRNMTLDATATTTGGKDNAAVQSIRKSKVKCYDLDIIKKATDMSQIAFYVNGNNEVDGVKYTAYLYVENCTLNSTKSFSVVSTKGSYKFYHNNLTYGGTTYTTNSGSTKNQTMASDNWEW